MEGLVVLLLAFVDSFVFDLVGASVDCVVGLDVGICVDLVAFDLVGAAVVGSDVGGSVTAM